MIHGAKYVTQEPAVLYFGRFTAQNGQYKMLYFGCFIAQNGQYKVLYFAQ